MRFLRRNLYITYSLGKITVAVVPIFSAVIEYNTQVLDILSKSTGLEHAARTRPRRSSWRWPRPCPWPRRSSRRYPRPWPQLCLLLLLAITVTACLGGGCHRGRDVAAAEVALSMAPTAAFQGEGGRVQRLRRERGIALTIGALRHRTVCQPASTFAATAPATNHQGER